METFVYGDIEVKKTGRLATKPMAGTSKMTLVEVTPVNDFDGSWKKFVNPNSLFTIVEANVSNVGQISKATLGSGKVLKD